MAEEQNRKKATVSAILYGVITFGMYYLFFANVKDILEMTAKGGWNVVLVIGIAFAFSGAHGNFTSSFWEALGVYGKSGGKK